MPAVQFVVEGGRTLKGSIRPSGNKNAALPIVAAALISENPVHLENVPRIRDIETLVELIKSVGASMEWVGQNALDIHARELRPADLNPTLCAQIEGVGTNTMTIHGGRALGTKPVTHTIGPDHIEVGSFIGLAAVTRSEIRIQNAGVEHLRSTRMGFERLGIECQVEGPDLI